VKRRRLLDKKSLEITLQSLEVPSRYILELEQYVTPPDIAAFLINEALLRGDIEDHVVADFGCGNGILGIAAALLGASEVIGIDVDPLCISTAWRNARRLGLMNVRFFTGDVFSLDLHVDTVVQNPPFGTKIRHMDILFLEKAIKCAEVVYSIHKAGNLPFIEKKVSLLGARLELLARMLLNIPKIYNFHKKRRYVVEVELYRVVR